MNLEVQLCERLYRIGYVILSKKLQSAIELVCWICYFSIVIFTCKCIFIQYMPAFWCVQNAIYISLVNIRIFFLQIIFVTLYMEINVWNKYTLLNKYDTTVDYDMPALICSFLRFAAMNVWFLIDWLRSIFLSDF